MSQENREEESKVATGAKVFLYVVVSVCGLILIYISFIKLLVKLSE